MSLTQLPYQSCAFTRFYLQYRDLVYEQASRILGGADAARDICQEVFLRCWKNRDKLTEVIDLSSYLKVITRHCCVDHLRKEQREQIHLDAYYAQYLPIWPPDGDPVREREYQQLMERAIAQLPDKQKNVFLLHYKEGCRIGEIADRLSISLTTVKYHRRLAVNTLRTYFEAVTN